MIIYGMRMQEKPEMVPVDVAAWVLERHNRYPDIDFLINYSEPDVSAREEVKRLVGQYSRVYEVRRPFGGVMSVTFPYKNQSWNISIKGGSKDGKIANRGEDDNWVGLTPELRDEIAGMPENVEKIHEDEESWVFGLPRLVNEPVQEQPVEFVPLPADGRWTSELTMSADEIVDLVKQPATKEKEALMHAISEKDWETAQRLLKQHR